VSDLNKRAELSRQRKRQMRGFKSPGHAQRFLYAHGPISNFFRPRCHWINADKYRTARDRGFDTWQQVTCARLTD
jgi:putative transposase